MSVDHPDLHSEQKAVVHYNPPYDPAYLLKTPVYPTIFDLHLDFSLAMDIFTNSKAYRCFQLATANSMLFTDIVTCTATKANDYKATNAIHHSIAADFLG